MTDTTAEIIMDPDDYIAEKERKKELRVIEDVILDRKLGDKYRSLLEKVVRFSREYVGNMLGPDERIELAHVLYSIMSKSDGELSLEPNDRELFLRVKQLMDRGILSDWFKNGEGQSPEFVERENARYRELLNYVTTGARLTKLDREYSEAKKTYIVFAIIFTIFLILLWWSVLFAGSIVAKIFSILGLFAMTGFIFVYQPYILKRMFANDLAEKDRLLEEIKQYNAWWR
jgi:hypothetical protein